MVNVIDLLPRETIIKLHQLHSNITEGQYYDYQILASFWEYDPFAKEEK